ncbi:Outer membrane protein TolC [Thalassolituus maritimus]|uniref:Outer membrane protein TolC n=1 Tax=Thalassolituus maritimus TaxID=484498 RepID=A0A1N7Q9I5_9GAMM|nr:TolC family protein [Thalassolituus maritimus]SIT19513.1 Outer membrane protein TolC [Thalassolituus maritimus]
MLVVKARDERGICLSPVRCLAGVVCIFSVLFFHDARATTLNETIELALQHSSLLRQQYFQTDLAVIDKSINEAERELELELHLQGGFGHVTMGKNASRYVKKGERFPLSAIVELSYPIDIWGIDDRDDKIADKTIQQRILEAEVVKHRTIVDVVNVYVALANGTLERHSQQQRVKFLSKKVEEAKQQLAVGLYTKPFVEQIIGEKVEAESLLADYDLSYSLNSLLYRRLTGQHPDSIDNEIGVPYFPDDIISIREGVDRSPQVRALQYALDVAQLQAKNTEASFRSTLELTANGGVQEGSIYLTERIYNYEFMLRWNIPLGNRASRAAANRSRTLISLQQEALQSTRELNESQILQLIRQHKIVAQQVGKLEEKLFVDVANLDATTRESNVGKSTEFEVMARRLDLLETQNLLKLNKNTLASIAYQIRGLLGIAD